jgi:hypothetical protein
VGFRKRLGYCKIPESIGDEEMKGLFLIMAATSVTGCATLETVTYDERIQIRQNMARLQTEQVQRQIIRYTNDKRN